MTKLRFNHNILLRLNRKKDEVEGQVKENLKAIIGGNIELLMSIYGKSRRDVAEDLNISYTTLTDWIKGNTYPRMETLEKLGYYFRIDISDFFVDMNKNQYQKERMLKYAEKLGVFLEEGDDEMTEDKKLMGKDARELFRHKSLEERAERYGGRLGPYEEMDPGKPMGREKW